MHVVLLNKCKRRAPPNSARIIAPCPSSSFMKFLSSTDTKMSTSQVRETEQTPAVAEVDEVLQLAEPWVALPAKLYRVQYYSCQTSYDDRGLHARHRAGPLPSLSTFTESIEDHFTWESKTPSRYISLFSDQLHARNWAISRSRFTGLDHHLITITTNGLSQSIIFKLSNLVASLQLNIPEGATQHISGAYICLYCVPLHAIEKTVSFDCDCES